MSDKENNPVNALCSLFGNVPMMGAERSAAEVDPMERPLWEVDEDFINPFADLPPVQTWLKMGERPAIPTAGIISFSAKPKEGKSYSTLALLIPILSGRRFDTLTPTELRPRLVIVFDTEMDRITLTNRARMMQSVLGKEAGKLLMFAPLIDTPLRDAEGNNPRQAKIDAITAKYHPDIVVIDQLTRMVNDFNNNAECYEFGEWLKAYAADKSVFVVIHQNKAADNSQMKGHLGSNVNELAVENYGVKKENGIFVVTPTNARQSAVDESSTPVTFALSEDGRIIDASLLIARQREAEGRVLREYFAEIFGEDKELPYSEIQSRVAGKEASKPRAAATKIQSAKSAGVIVKTSDDHRAPYRLVDTSDYFAAVDLNEDGNL